MKKSLTSPICFYNSQMIRLMARMNNCFNGFFKIYMNNIIANNIIKFGIGFHLLDNIIKLYQIFSDFTEVVEVA